MNVVTAVVTSYCHNIRCPTLHIEAKLELTEPEAESCYPHGPAELEQGEDAEHHHDQDHDSDHHLQSTGCGRGGQRLRVRELDFRSDCGHHRPGLVGVTSDPAVREIVEAALGLGLPDLRGVIALSGGGGVPGLGGESIARGIGGRFDGFSS